MINNDDDNDKTMTRIVMRTRASGIHHLGTAVNSAKCLGVVFRDFKDTTF